MFAMVVFCTAMFVILAMVSNLLTNARRLQQRSMVDAGVVAAELSQTNQLVEGVYTKNLGDLLGDAYNGYSCTYDIEEAQTNKLFRVDFIIQGVSGDKPVVSKMSILLFCPNSPAGSLDGGPTLR
jgi:hypothetical protein